ncbi:MAG: coiled-coil domain-containing protein [Candidatus Asgardarchaeia archaeon]
MAIDLKNSKKDFNELVRSLDKLSSEMNNLKEKFEMIKKLVEENKISVEQNLNLLKDDLRAISNSLDELLKDLDYLKRDSLTAISDSSKKIIDVLNSRIAKVEKSISDLSHELRDVFSKISNKQTEIFEYLLEIGKSIETDFLIVDRVSHKIVTRNRLKKGHKYNIYYKKLGLLRFMKDYKVIIEFQSPIDIFLTQATILLSPESNSNYLVGELNVEKPVGKYEALKNTKTVRGTAVVYLVNNVEKIIIDRYPIEIAGIDSYFLLAIGSILFALAPSIANIFAITIFGVFGAIVAVASLYMIVSALIDIMR